MDPKDVKDQPLKVGDVVGLDARIIAIDQSLGDVSVTVEMLGRAAGAHNLHTVSINPRQCVRLESSPVAFPDVKKGGGA